jgi:hypothetical protein
MKDKWKKNRKKNVASLDFYLSMLRPSPIGRGGQVTDLTFAGRSCGVSAG